MKIRFSFYRIVFLFVCFFVRSRIQRTFMPNNCTCITKWSSAPLMCQITSFQLDRQSGVNCFHCLLLHHFEFFTGAFLRAIFCCEHDEKQMYKCLYYVFFPSASFCGVIWILTNSFVLKRSLGWELRPI